MSNPLARRFVTDRSGVWLLELDLGAEFSRVATRRASVESEFGTLLFRAGLSDFDFVNTSTSLNVKVSKGREAWSTLRRRLGPLQGRRFKLWRWFEDTHLDDAYLALDGVVKTARWADPRAPGQLNLTLTRNNLALSAVHPGSGLRVTRDTWTNYADNLEGEVYPIPIGAPGSRSGNQVSSQNPLQVTPGLYVNNQTLSKQVLIAGCHVAAETVRLFNRSSSLTLDQVDLPVVNTVDALNQPVALVETYSQMGVRDLETNDEILIGWDRHRDGWGVGLMHGGRPVAGLGDLLVWGAETLTTSVWDRDQLQAHRASLNQFKIDTYWNQPMPWEAWVQANILGTFPVEEVQGPRGRYYRTIVYEADRQSAVAHITTRGSGSGRHVERVAPVVEVAQPIVNRYELAYGGYSTKNWMRYTRNIGPRKGSRKHTGAGTATIETYGADHLAAVSDTYYDERWLQERVPQVHDDVTANAIARWRLHTQALPGRRTTYLAGSDCFELVRGDQVIVHDTSQDANLSNEVGIIERVVWVTEGVELDLYIPEDPLGEPTVGTTGAVVGGVCTRPDGTWTLVQALHGAVLQDPNTLNAGNTGLNEATGTFTFDRNTTAGNHDGFNDGNLYYAIPVGGGVGNLLPNWDPTAEDLEVLVVEEDALTAGSSDGVYVALVDGATQGSLNGVGFGFRYRQVGGRIDTTRQSSTSNGLTIELTTGASIDSVWGSWQVAPAGEVVQTSLFSEDGTSMEPHLVYESGSVQLGAGQKYLMVQCAVTTGGTKTADSCQVKVYVRRVLRVDYD